MFSISRMKAQENFTCNDVHCCAVCMYVCVHGGGRVNMHVGGYVHTFLNVYERPWGSKFLGVRRPKAGPLILPDTVANHNLSLGSLCNSDQA